VSVAWGWREREVPLIAAGALARGEVARRLAARLEGSRHLRGVVGPGFLVVLGEPLPWVEGLDHLGRDPGAPLVWWPTRLEPDLPAELVARAVARQADIALPAVITPWLLVPLDAARTIDGLDLAAGLAG
jgi:hypothetical protein